MKLCSFFLSDFRVLVVVGYAVLGAGGELRAGSDSAVAPEGRPQAVRLDEYLRSQHVEHAVETAPGSEAVVVKIYDVTAAPRQDALCAGLAADGKHDRLQNVTVQFLAAETSSAVVQSYQPSSLPSGNATVVNTQRATETTRFKLLRVVKLQEPAVK